MGYLSPLPARNRQSSIDNADVSARKRPGYFRHVTSATLKSENEKYITGLDDDNSVETGTVAFAFDIDGVLVQGAKPIPGARETIKMLQDNNIPFIFLTNGGGLTEKDHVAKLGGRLNLTLDEKQFVQSHTPFYDLVPKYKDKTILVLGGHKNNIRDLAHAYGFNKVVTSSDLMAAWEHIHPFPELTKHHHVEHGRPIEQPQHVEIAAILVWSSPRDWVLDLQVICDLLLSSGGKFGKKSSRNGTIHLPNNGYLQDNQPRLYFCNPDFEWATQHDHPRFAQGAFREALKGIFAHATKGKAELEYSVIGKPTEATYAYGEKTLHAYNDALNAELGVNRKIKTVYMVGDNPESDIRGANSFKSRIGAEWKSILVESGVYEAGTKPTYTPTHFAKDVKDAVQQALVQEGVELESDLLESRLALLDIKDQN
ncbi:putative HAD-like domain-containing protein [Seiridium cardinale]